MILDIALIVYGVVALFTWRILAGHLAWKYKSKQVDRPEGFDWLGGAFFGFFGALAWPGVLALRGVRQLQLPAVGAERQGREQLHTAQREANRKAAEEHLAELERSTIDDDQPPSAT